MRREITVDDVRLLTAAYGTRGQAHVALNIVRELCDQLVDDNSISLASMDALSIAISKIFQDLELTK